MNNKFILLIMLVATLLLSSCADTVNSNHPNVSPMEGEFLGAKETQTTSDEADESIPSEEISQDFVTDLSTIIEKAESFVDVPIYGTYLEETSSVVRQYFKNNTIFATVALSDGEMIHDFDIYNPLGHLKCLNVTRRCQTQFPNYPIIGYVYETDGYSVIYPIVMNTDETKVQYYFGGLSDFRMVDPFQTIADGRQAYVDYFAEQKEILSEIPIYPWTEADNNYNYSYLNKFLLDDIWDDTSLIEKLSNTEFIFLYDFYIAIPLLDDKGNEGVFVGYLLYQKNKLIAELVLKVDESIYVADFINVADYNTQTKTFDFIETSNYEKAIKIFGGKDDNLTSSLDGIIWESQKYCVESRSDRK